MTAKGCAAVEIGTLIKRLDGGVEVEAEIKRLEPLFTDKADYEEFYKRHKKAVAKRCLYATAYRGYTRLHSAAFRSRRKRQHCRWCTEYQG